MKKKTKKTLIILLCVIAFIAVAGYVAYNVAIDYVQEKMISSVVEKMIDSGEISDSELDAILESLEDTAELSQDTDSETSSVEGEKAENPVPSEKKEQPTQSGKTDKKEPAKEEKKTQAVDKFTEKIMNSISREEKLAMTRLITSRLSGGDIKYLASLLAGGLTRDERAAAYRLAKSRFSAGELSLVKDYYHRYKAQIMIEPDLVPKK